MGLKLDLLICLQVRTLAHVSVLLLADMFISFCTGMQYKDLVVGTDLLLATSDVPWFGVWMRSILSVFLLAQFFWDLVSLALTKPRWTVALTLWMSHCSVDKNGLAKV